MNFCSTCQSLVVQGTSAASDSITGSIITAGGLGVAGKVYSGDALTVQDGGGNVVNSHLSSTALDLRSTHATFAGSTLALKTTRAKSAAFKFLSATADATLLFDIEGTGKTTIYEGGLNVVAGGATIQSSVSLEYCEGCFVQAAWTRTQIDCETFLPFVSKGLTVVAGGGDIQSGGLRVRNGGVTVDQDGVTVSDGGTTVTNSAANAAGSSISASSSSFVHTVVSCMVLFVRVLAFITLTLLDYPILNCTSGYNSSTFTPRVPRIQPFRTSTPDLEAMPMAPILYST